MAKEEAESIRIDKWLWAVRVFKTRSLASTACNNNQVIINGVHVKPSRTIKAGEIIQVKKAPIIKTYEVLAILSKRQSAKVVVDYIKDITPQEEIDKLQLLRLQSSGYRDKGEGRPTKKDRRSLEDFGFM